MNKQTKNKMNVQNSRKITNANDYGWTIESSQKSIKSGITVPKAVHLNSDTENLLKKLEKKNRGEGISIKIGEDNQPYVLIKNDGRISENYLNKLAEDYLYDGYSVKGNNIKIDLDNSIMYTAPLTNSRKPIKSAVDEGWVVESDEANEALDLFVKYFGEETALEEIARAMGTIDLEDNIDYIAENWEFADEIEDKDAWDKYEYAKEVMGVTELLTNLTDALSTDELAECLVYIFRQYDFREWDKHDEEIESSAKKRTIKSSKSAIECFPISEEQAKDVDELRETFADKADLRSALEDYFSMYTDYAEFRANEFDAYFEDYMSDEIESSTKKRAIKSSFVDEFKAVVDEIGEEKFRKNVQEWEPDVDWHSMTLSEIIKELIAFDVDPATFEF